MLCLGIETSCDETALALVCDGKVLAETLASQIELHSIFGGVVPELASREHLRFISLLFDELLKKAHINMQDIDLVAVARGPGLLGSLLVGGAFAKSLALGLDIPVLGVNHLHAHLLACGIEHHLEYPALGLVVSGGHTYLFKISSPAAFMPIGRSIDDACGEAFDKTGNLLGFAYPSGKFIDQFAQQGQNGRFKLPLPYIDNENLDFSFSGLKTAAANLIIASGLQDAINQKALQKDIADFCHAFNECAAETLVIKTKRALQKFEDIAAIWLAGGVAANSLVRARLQELAQNSNKEFIAPAPKYCTDNAAMIAYAGWLLGQEGYYNNLDFEIVPRGKKIPEDVLKTSLSD